MNCKPGDLAIAINATITPEMIGLLVEIIRPAVNGEVLSHGMSIDNDGYMCWVVRRAGGGRLPMRTNWNILHMVEERSFADMYLRPVSGLPEVETTDEQIKEPA